MGDKVETIPINQVASPRVATRDPDSKSVGDMVDDGFAVLLRLLHLRAVQGKYLVDLALATGQAVPGA